MRRSYCLLLLLLLTSFCGIAQQNEIRPFSLEASVFTGTIIEHNSDIAHLITDHPSGLLLSYNRKTYGFNEWESRYNFPDWGFTFLYQDMKNTFLGENYGIYGHFTWYFLERQLSFSMGQGIAYNTNPYDPETNFENRSYGSTLLSSTFLRFNYVNENLYKGIGLKAGLSLIHYSNANYKAPNNSTNTIAFEAAVTYQFDELNFPGYIGTGGYRSKFYAEPIKYNLVLRTGTNEADEIGLGQAPFYVVSAYADKRLNYKSTVQVGVDVFFSNFLIDFIRFRSVAFPGDGLTGDEDYRRVGAFIGHEFRFNRVAFVSQLGYYVYWPVEFENRIYNSCLLYTSPSPRD